MRYAICGLFSAFICWFVILLSHLPMRGYDCRLASYPQAVDVPQEIIQQCRKASEK
jgi:hypothetical protein